MIDYQEMVKRQQQGIALLESLQNDEKEIIKHYCSLSADAVLQLAKSRKASTPEAMVNAYRTGLALGLQLNVDNGEVK